MTGFGNATQQSEHADVSVELKAVNNRYLKISMRLPDVVSQCESDVEKLIRETITRGSVQLSVRVRLKSAAGANSIDAAVLKNYVTQLTDIHSQLGLESSAALSVTELLELPGVIAESDVRPEITTQVWPSLKSTISEALTHFDEFRRAEGQSMRQDLQLQCQTIEHHVDQVAEQAPGVVAEYREKLLERVRKAVEAADVTIESKDIIRDVAVFADRCDINEEITRLRSHIEQFHRFLNSDTSMGRKLEFVGQEMFREINTIGSKANNVSIAHSVVDMKAAIERIREVLQNVE